MATFLKTLKLLFLIVLTYDAAARPQDTTTSSIVLTSTGPATFNLPIRFDATYNDFNPTEDITYEWNDSLSHQQKVLATSPQSQWTLIYNRESYLYYTGIQVVTVSVKKKNVKVTSANITFELTDYLNGKILIEQQQRQRHAKQITNLTVLIHDPYDWIKLHSIDTLFSWVINKKRLATCNTPSLLFSFTKPGKYNIEALVYLEIVEHVITSTNRTKHKQRLAPPFPRTWECGGDDGWWPNNYAVNNISIKRQAIKVKVGYFGINIAVKYNNTRYLLPDFCYYYYYYITIVVLTIIILFMCVYLFLISKKIKSTALPEGWFQNKVKYYLQLCRNNDKILTT